MPSGSTTVTYDEVLAQHLGVMDASAIALARENERADHRLQPRRAGRLPGHPGGAGNLHDREVENRARRHPVDALREIQFWNLNTVAVKPLKTTQNRTRRSGTDGRR
jgi:hypothetical protein